MLQTNDDFAADRQKSVEIIKLLQKSNKNTPDLFHLLTAGEKDGGEGRFDSFSRNFEGILLDFARTGLTSESFSLLLELARSSGLDKARDKFFSGHRINLTEDRPVLHHLWRHGNFDNHLEADDAAAMARSMTRMAYLADALSKGQLPDQQNQGKSSQGEPGDEHRIRHLVHIGIGGSLLGPKMLSRALPQLPDSPQLHFLSSADAHDRDSLLKTLNPRETVVVLVSKSFTTSEVILHGKRLMAWMSALTSDLTQGEAQRRFFAVTSAPAKALAFGVPEDNILSMGEWTGGRDYQSADS